MEDSDWWLNQDSDEVIRALEALGALEEMVNALAAKTDYLDRRLSKAEDRLEEIAREQD